MPNPTFMQANRSGNVPGEHIISLHEGFEWAATLPSQFQTPAAFNANINFAPASVPGSVANMVNDDIALEKLNDFDHWYRIAFSVPTDLFCSTIPSNTILELDGLLTLADVFLNGHLILQSNNAYHTHFVDIGDKLLPTNQLAICFRALSPLLASKLPRGRFITRLANQRNLRFVRTPLLGYMPGFAPATKLVGPYRPIKLIVQTEIAVISARVEASLLEKNAGKISVDIVLKAVHGVDNSPLASCFLVLIDNEATKEIKRVPFELHHDANGTITLAESFSADGIEAYWPHTHGNPKRYQLNVEFADGAQSTSIINLGHYGFRSVALVNQQTFAIKINDVPLFLRGACWTPMDVKSLYVSAEQLTQRLTLLRNAGINMLRVPGNMLYEQDEFYEICDALGILIFQDFAFANFDYPEDDAAFVASVQREAETFLAKHGSRACMVILAGNSEVQQQASMMGLPLTALGNAIFDTHLPAIAKALAPNALYVRSSPSANLGANHVPFYSGAGPSHYYGVGGYKRGFEDARLFKGKFASECLAFSHVPEDTSLRTFFDGEIFPPHHPRWKDAVPRDNGAGWDFTDITDFYVEKCFGVSTVSMRTVDQSRYLDYCRAAMVEVVERTLSIFRADSTEGRAALVWFLHDVKPGSGWGYIDALGHPKSAFYGLARVAQPTTIIFVDEGLEGLALYLTHEGAKVLNATLTISLITTEGRVFETATSPQLIAAHSVTRLNIDTLLGRFVDSSYAYQFGPRAFVSCVASLQDVNGQVISQKVYADATVTHALSSHTGLSAIANIQADGSYLLTIATLEPAFFVVIDVPEFLPSDNYFHVMPEFEKQVLLTSANKQAMPRGKIRALNANESTSVQIVTTV